MTKIQPPPGSDEAIRKGCSCPQMDNHHGQGIDKRGKLFWLDNDCPLHGTVKI